MDTCALELAFVASEGNVLETLEVRKRMSKNVCVCGVASLCLRDLPELEEQAFSS